MRRGYFIKNSELKALVSLRLRLGSFSLYRILQPFLTAIAAKQKKSNKDFHITCVDNNWYTVKKLSLK